MTYFVCNLGDFAVESLLKFSIDKSVIIAIREYGVIENGELFLQNFGSANKINGEFRNVQ